MLAVEVVVGVRVRVGEIVGVGLTVLVVVGVGGSSKHVALQPSPLMALPSSHSSQGASTTPLPHVGPACPAGPTNWPKEIGAIPTAIRGKISALASLWMLTIETLLLFTFTT
jgi:hypothetical protein